jgi:hypothetical protein
MKVHSVPWLIAAVVLGFVLLAFIHKFELFGVSCYYIGSFSPNSACIAPWLYYGAWLAAAAMAAVGVFGPISDSSSRQGSDKNYASDPKTCTHEYLPEPQNPEKFRCKLCGETW